MTTKTQTYPKYKSSGIDWLGEIPAGWNLQKIAAIFDFRNTKVSDRDFEPLSVTYDGVKKQIEHAAKTDNNENRKLVKSGDIAINGRSDRKGAVGISQYDGSVSGVYHVLKPKNHGVEVKYFHYLFRNPLFSQEFFKWGRGIHDDLWTTRSTEMGHITVSLPPLETQKRIADFLDDQTRVVGELIAKKEKLIDLLREKRAALITRAATKGLDPNIKLKPSGVNWLGDIPEGWEMKRFKFIARLQYGNSLAAENREIGDVPVYGSNGQVGTHSQANTKAPVIIVGRKGSFGAVNYVEEPVFAIDTTYFIDERWSSENLKWLNYCMSVANLNDISLDTGVPGLSCEAVHNKAFPLPQKTEQKQIADYLDAETIKIDKATTLIESQIEKLKEYRSSLIYSAVIGKIKI